MHAPAQDTQCKHDDSRKLKDRNCHQGETIGNIIVVVVVVAVVDPLRDRHVTQAISVDCRPPPPPVRFRFWIMAADPPLTSWSEYRPSTLRCVYVTHHFILHFLPYCFPLQEAPLCSTQQWSTGNWQRTGARGSIPYEVRGDFFIWLVYNDFGGRKMSFMFLLHLLIFSLPSFTYEKEEVIRIWRWLSSGL
jgi:hypothetical protein